MTGHNPPSKLHPLHINETHTMLYSGKFIWFFSEVLFYSKPSSYCSIPNQSESYNFYAYYYYIVLSLLKRYGEWW